jgi:hypothetical protein
MKTIQKVFALAISGILCVNVGYGMEEKWKQAAPTAPKKESRMAEDTKKFTPMKEFTYVPRGLLVFLDDSEIENIRSDDVEAITDDVLLALSQEASPFIVSESLLYCALMKEATAKKIKHIDNDVKWENWIIKETSEDSNLFLLVHKSHLKLLSIPEEAFNIYSSDEITPTELKLGLKVNHMLNKQIPQKGQPPKKACSSEVFAQSLNKIFCVNLDYQKTNTPKPLWAFFLSGHGEEGKHNREATIVGMPIELFHDNVLTFLENKINTRLLLYFSCYAAGINTEKIYAQTKTCIQETYQFAIITAALTDAPTRALKKMNFEYFLSETTKSDFIDYAHLITELILPAINQRSFGKKYIYWGTTPQIKLPGLEWFSVLGQNDIVSIGHILALAHEGRILNIDTYFRSKTPLSERKNIDILFPNTKPKALLLYTKDIPCELVINSEKMEAIISMMPGDVYHKIKKISSSYWTIDDILNWFIAVTRIKAIKVFTIDEIQTKDETITGVFIYMRPARDCYERNVFFHANGKLFSQKGDFGGSLKDENNLLFRQPRIEVDQRKLNDHRSFVRRVIEGKLMQPFSITPESIQKLESITKVRKQPPTTFEDLKKETLWKQRKKARATWRQLMAEQR